MIVHTIRLDEPWERAQVAVEGQTLLRSTRRFGRPYSLPADERVILMLENFGDSPRVELNGQSLNFNVQSAGLCGADVTELLAPRSELVVHSSPEGSTGVAILHMTRAGD